MKLSIKTIVEQNCNKISCFIDENLTDFAHYCAPIARAHAHFPVSRAHAPTVNAIEKARGIGKKELEK